MPRGEKMAPRGDKTAPREDDVALGKDKTAPSEEYAASRNESAGRRPENTPAPRTAAEAEVKDAPSIDGEDGDREKGKVRNLASDSSTSGQCFLLGLVRSPVHCYLAGLNVRLSCS